MAMFAKNDETRAAIWAHLVVYPGLTAHEIKRAVLRGHAGNATLAMCRRMECDGQLTSKNEYRAQQGREVTCWYAAPGAFAVGARGESVEKIAESWSLDGSRRRRAAQSLVAGAGLRASAHRSDSASGPAAGTMMSPAAAIMPRRIPCPRRRGRCRRRQITRDLLDLVPVDHAAQRSKYPEARTPGQGARGAWCRSQGLALVLQ